LKQQRAFAPDFAVLCLWQAALALDKTHSAGIVHRDLKPENLFLTTRDDGSPQLKILDFGIAKIVAQSSGAKTTRNVGTPYYMSPEQIGGAGKIDKRADLYSLGHVAFTLLVGKPYWLLEAESLQGAIPLLVRVLQGGISENATERAARFGTTLPLDFDPWFRRATAYDPSERHFSASQLVENLSLVLDVAPPRRDSSRASTPDRVATVSRSREAISHRPMQSALEGAEQRRHKATRFELMRTLLPLLAGVILLLTIVVGLAHSRRVVSGVASAPSVAVRAVVVPGTQVFSQVEPATPVPASVPSPPALVTAAARASARARGVKDRGGRRAAPANSSRTDADQAQLPANSEEDPTDIFR
jgi:serine/threonine-protein kinase